MKFFKIIIVIILLSFFYSCSPKTTVILLRDDNGKVGKVVVKANKGKSIILDKPGYKTVVSSEKSSPSKPEPVPKKELEKELNPIQVVEPLKPVSFLLYFKNNSTELTKESKAKLKEILKEIKKREPCEVSLIGHSDTAGSSEYNIKLSRKRAEAVKRILLGYGVKLQKLNVTSFGESDLLVKTKDNVSEPRNRRVEVMIR